MGREEKLGLLVTCAQFFVIRPTPQERQRFLKKYINMKNVSCWERKTILAMDKILSGLDACCKEIQLNDEKCEKKIHAWILRKVRPIIKNKKNCSAVRLAAALLKFAVRNKQLNNSIRESLMKK